MYKSQPPEQVYPIDIENENDDDNFESYRQQHSEFEESKSSQRHTDSQQQVVSLHNDSQKNNSLYKDICDVEVIDQLPDSFEHERSRYQDEMDRTLEMGPDLE